MSVHFDFAGREIVNLTGFDILIDKPKDFSFILGGTVAQQPSYTGSVLFTSKTRVGLAARCKDRTIIEAPTSCGVRMVETSQFVAGEIEMRMPDGYSSLAPKPGIGKLYIVPGDVAALLLATRPFTAESTRPPIHIAVAVDLKMPITFGEPAQAKALHIFKVDIE